jgi:serine/threonine protein kinase/WD40 repeat protein
VMAINSVTPNGFTRHADASEERFTSVLAACDEALAAGDETPPTESGNAPAELHERLARAVACMRLLREAMPGPGRAHARAPDRLLGDFEIGRELGRGGMGVVYEARQVSLNRLVALKVLANSTGLTPSAVARFRREAETAARLHHTNIVPIYATGEEGGTHYYAMELVAGPSLDRVLGQLRHDSTADPLTLLTSRDDAAGAAATAVSNREPTDRGSPAEDRSSALGSDSRYFETVARLIAEVADALHYAHQNGVVHRDIKPANLLLSADGRLRVSDFGLARLLEQPGMTASGDFVGTPAYMSPEQFAAGRGVDRRTDVYSLGATLYELLTLQPPFPGENRAEILAQVLQKEPTPARRLNPKVPRDLETICVKALEKNPARRYPSAAELAADLRRFLAGEPVTARRVGALGRMWKRARRRPVVAGLLATVIGLMIVGAIAVTVLWRRAEAALAGEKTARQDEVAQREKTEAELTAKLLLLARINWEAARVTSAVGHLRECPEQHRGPEWRYLDRMCRLEVMPPLGQEVNGLARIAYSPDGKLLATLTATHVRVWNLADQRQVFPPIGVEPSRFSWLDFTPDGGRVVVLGMAPPNLPANLRPPHEGGPLPWLRVHSPDALWRFAILDTASGQVIQKSQFFGPFNDAVGRSAAGLRLATSNGAMIRVRNFASDETLEFEHGHRVVRILEFNADGRHLLSTGPGEPIKIWDASIGRLLATIPSERLPGTILDADRQLMSPDGRRLIRSRSPEHPTMTTQIWDIEHNRELVRFDSLGYSFSRARFSPDGRSLAIAFGDFVRVWDLTSGRETHVLRGHTQVIQGIAFAPDGTRLASISMDQTIRVWDVSPYEE